MEPILPKVDLGMFIDSDCADDMRIRRSRTSFMIN